MGRALREVSAVLIACGLLAAGRANAEFRDAENYDMAAGMMLHTLVTVGVHATSCSAKFPELAPDIAVSSSNWEKTEAKAIAAMTARFTRIDARSPGTRERFERRVAGAMQELVDKAIASPEGEVYCRGTFADLAVGKWRLRTPNVYDILENGTPPSD
jgi:hypothetical protein